MRNMPAKLEDQMAFIYCGPEIVAVNNPDNPIILSELEKKMFKDVVEVFARDLGGEFLGLKAEMDFDPPTTKLTVYDKLLWFKGKPVLEAGIDHSKLFPYAIRSIPLGEQLAFSPDDFGPFLEMTSKLLDVYTNKYQLEQIKQTFLPKW